MKYPKLNHLCYHCSKPFPVDGHFYEVKVTEWDRNRGKVISTKRYHLDCRPPE